MNPLEQLKDIAEPQTVSAWPWAWGWWLSLAILLLTLCVMVYRALNTWRFNRARREAKEELKSMSNTRSCGSELNALLKRVCISYFGRDIVAAQYGEKWLEFLTLCLPQAKQTDFREGWQQLLSQLYQPQINITQQRDYIALAAVWLKHANLRKGGKHV